MQVSNKFMLSQNGLLRGRKICSQTRLTTRFRSLPETNDITNVSNEKKLKERWNRNIERGVVKQFFPNEELKEELEKDDWYIVDVRPEFEQRRAPIEGAVHIPLFTSEHNYLNNPFVIPKVLIALFMGGLWQGFFHTELNNNFMYYAHGMFNRTDKLLVVCQQGLRSLACADQLYIEGFKTVAVVNGGLNKAHEYFKTTNGKDPRYGDVGGIQGYLGLTKTQKILEHGFGKGGHLFRLGLTFLTLDIGALLILYIASIVKN